MKETKIIAYKGFDENLCSIEFQFEVGKEYELDGGIEYYDDGFHAWTNPLDVLDYYEANGTNRFCVVEQSGIIKSDKGDSMQLSSKIKIIDEIGFAGLFKAGIEWIKEKTNPDKIIEIAAEKGNVESSNSVQTASNGDYAKISSIGDSANIVSSGEYAHIGSSGTCAHIFSSGDYAQIGSSGYSVKIGSGGKKAQIGSSGNCPEIVSSGGFAKIGSSGDYADIVSIGYIATIFSSGYFAHIVSSGSFSKIFSSGNSANIVSSGGFAKIECTGDDSVICCAGRSSMVKAKKGSWMTLSEWKISEEKKRDIPVCVRTEFVDGERIKEDTWYKLVDGEFKEQ